MFADRDDAGRWLGAVLSIYATHHPVVVALPRGGVPVAAPIAERLGAPLDVILVRKLGCPWQPELGVGAIAEDGVRLVNKALVRELGVTSQQLADVTTRETAELARRAACYRSGRVPVDLRDRTVIVVDDGVAMGFTMRAAIKAIRHRGARRVILAVPCGSEGAIGNLRGVVDSVAVIVTADHVNGIGEFYEDFAPVSDDEVVAILDRAASMAMPSVPVMADV